MVYPDIFEPDRQEGIGTGADQQKEGSIVILKNT